MRRGDLTAIEWRDLKELLATARSRRGRPPEQTRAVINGILWRLRTGAPWRDIPVRYGDWNKIYRRFRRWSQSGVWTSVAAALGDLDTNNNAKAGPRPPRGDIRINRRRGPGSGLRFAKGQDGAGLSARMAARVSSMRRSATR